MDLRCKRLFIVVLIKNHKLPRGVVQAKHRGVRRKSYFFDKWKQRYLGKILLNIVL
eukprot:XP_001704366.1 Hypothetical protein GL50803_38281 [Giardia lamblia ATCC 50803]